MGQTLFSDLDLLCAVVGVEWKVKCSLLESSCSLTLTVSLFPFKATEHHLVSRGGAPLEPGPVFSSGSSPASTVSASCLIRRNRKGQCPHTPLNPFSRFWPSRLEDAVIKVNEGQWRCGEETAVSVSLSGATSCNSVEMMLLCHYLRAGSTGREMASCYLLAVCQCRVNGVWQWLIWQHQHQHTDLTGAHRSNSRGSLWRRRKIATLTQFI